MNPFEKDIFYGKKIHPSQSDYLNADGMLVSGGTPTSDRSGASASLSVSDRAGASIVPPKQVSDRPCAVRTEAPPESTTTQGSGAATPPSPSMPPYMGTFQFPQQGYYPDGNGQQGGISNQTLIFIALGIAAIGGIIYYKKHNA